MASILSSAVYISLKLIWFSYKSDYIVWNTNFDDIPLGHFIMGREGN